jgi:hypothetical protein
VIHGGIVCAQSGWVFSVTWCCFLSNGQCPKSCDLFSSPFPFCLCRWDPDGPTDGGIDRWPSGWLAPLAAAGLVRVKISRSMWKVFASMFRSQSEGLQCEGWLFVSFVQPFGWLVGHTYFFYFSRWTCYLVIHIQTVAAGSRCPRPRDTPVAVQCVPRSVSMELSTPFFGLLIYQFDLNWTAF